MDAIRKYLTDPKGRNLTPNDLVALAVQYYHHIQDVYEGLDRDTDVVFCSCDDCESFVFMFMHASAGMCAAMLHDEECGTDPDTFAAQLIVERDTAMDAVSVYPSELLEKFRRNTEYGRNNAAQN